MTANDDQSREVFSKPPMEQFTTTNYQEHSETMKVINDWLVKDYVDRLNHYSFLYDQRQRELKVTTQKLGDKDTELKLANQEIAHLKDVSIIQFGLGVLSIVLYGIGINYVTSTPPNEAGKYLIAAAIAAQVFSFIMTILARRRKSS